MFDALGVRAVLSSRDLDEGTGAPFRRPGCRNTRVYENTDAYPRAWVVHDVHVVEGEDEAFGFLKAHASRKDDAFIVDSFDPRREAVVENRGKTTDDRSTRTARRTGRSVPAETATVRPSSATQETLCLFGSRRVAPGSSFSRTRISPAGKQL